MNQKNPHILAFLLFWLSCAFTARRKNIRDATNSHYWHRYPMSAQLRTTLRFLHRWIGFPAGVFLFILCFTGALAAFDQEIQSWMQPTSTLVKAPLFPSKKALTQAVSSLKEELQNGRFAFLKLPSPRDESFRLWHYDGHIFLGPALSPETGTPLPSSEVLGGSFFATLHCNLYLPQPWGIILTLLAGLALIATTLTGLWLQLRRFLPDLLLFRPRAHPHRRWLDLHLLAGTLTLPALLLAGISGVVLQSQDLLRIITPPHPPSGHISRHQQNIFSPPATSSLDVLALSQKGQQQWGRIAGGFLMQRGNEIGLYAPDDLHFCLKRQVITPHYPLAPSQAACSTVRSIFAGLHDFRWADLTSRWLYFGVGILGCLIIASGMVLFLRTEAYNHPHNAEKAPCSPNLFSLYYSLTVSTLIGLPIASFALLWSTRLASPLSSSIMWEKIVFFSLWGLSGLHAILMQRAHTQQAILLTLLALGLPLLDLATRPWHTARPFLFGSVDLISVTLGLSAACFVLRKKTEGA